MQEIIQTIKTSKIIAIVRGAVCIQTHSALQRFMTAEYGLWKQPTCRRQRF